MGPDLKTNILTIQREFWIDLFSPYALCPQSRMNPGCNGLENIRVSQCQADCRTWDIYEVEQAVVHRKTNLDIILAFQEDRMLGLHPCNVDWDFHYYKRFGNQRKE